MCSPGSDLATLPASYNLVAVNLSLSSDSVLANCDQSILAAAVGKLKSAGVATIAASGNGGFATGLGVPACISATVSVGATYADRDVFWSQSNFSMSLDLLAPGVGIVSPAPGGTFSGTTGPPRLRHTSPAHGRSSASGSIPTTWTASSPTCDTRERRW